MSVSVHDIYSSSFYLALCFFVSILSPFAFSEHHSVSLGEEKGGRGKKKKRNLIALTNKVSWDRQPTQGRMFHGDSEREMERKWACETLVAPLHLHFTTEACLSAATQEGFCRFSAAQPLNVTHDSNSFIDEVNSVCLVWKIACDEWLINWTILINHPCLCARMSKRLTQSCFWT